MHQRGEELYGLRKPASGELWLTWELLKLRVASKVVQLPCNRDMPTQSSGAPASHLALPNHAQATVLPSTLSSHGVFFARTERFVFDGSRLANPMNETVPQSRYVHKVVPGSDTSDIHSQLVHAP